ncbi:alginate export family protein [Maribacter sp. 2-571]|uniref:alginate export family protein n=1 Tax=Maribacter sp. 2-571 TaxID=3417569 RepID=UPI003D33E0A3
MVLIRKLFFITVLVLLAHEDSMAQEKGSQPILPIRFLENYGYLKDSTKLRHFYDPVKYIPMNENGSSYLSLGGETRLMYQSIYNRQDEGEGYLLTRVMLHADIYLGKRLRIFLQPAMGLDFFKEAMPAPVDRDELFLLNAFVDYDFLNEDSKSLILRVGRQELNYGAGHLITIREGPNVRQYWEGAKVAYEAKGLSVDSFVTQFGKQNLGIFDNPILDSDETLWGIYSTLDKSFIKGFSTDIYYLGFEQDETQFFNATGKETRHSLGVRIFADKGAFDYDLEVTGQFGKAGESDIRAHGIFSNIGYTFDAEKPFQKRLGLKANYFSGDTNAEDNKLNSFNPMYPRQGYYQGAAALYGTNFWYIHPSFTVAYGKEFSFNVNWAWYWRTQKEDGIYVNGSGIPLIAPTGSDTLALGKQLDFNCKYAITKYTSVVIDYSHFFAEGFIAENETPQEISDFLNVILLHRF